MGRFSRQVDLRAALAGNESRNGWLFIGDAIRTGELLESHSLASGVVISDSVYQLVKLVKFSALVESSSGVVVQEMGEWRNGWGPVFSRI